MGGGDPEDPIDSIGGPGPSIESPARLLNRPAPSIEQFSPKPEREQLPIEPIESIECFGGWGCGVFGERPRLLNNRPVY